jgi:hypothetical protein
VIASSDVLEHDASIADSSNDMRGLPQHAKDKTAVVGVAISPTSRCARHESEEQNVIDATCRLLHLRVAASHRQCLALQRIVSRSLEERMQMDTDTADADANDLEAGNVHEEELLIVNRPARPGPEERPASAPAPSTRRPQPRCVRRAARARTTTTMRSSACRPTRFTLRRMKQQLRRQQGGAGCCTDKQIGL